MSYGYKQGSMNLQTPIPRRFTPSRPLLAALALSLLSTGCAVGPEYHPPATDTPVSWQAPRPHGGDVASMAEWWKCFDDPLVAELISIAEQDSPSLTKAWANIEKARASLRSVQSGASPNVSGSASATRGNQGLTSTAGGAGTGSAATTTSRSTGLDASWELDLFGKVKRNVQAAQARVEEHAADWHDARVSLAAEVVDTYVQYQGCMMLVDVYERQLTSVKATDRSTSILVAAGFSASADASLAHASTATTLSTLTEQRGACDVLVKSLIFLTGLDEPALRGRLAKSAGKIAQPAALAVGSVPADVLRQRPDLASLERELAATSAEIGAAKADLYPSLSLSGSITLSASSLAASATSWSFGPTLSLPIFDGGKRRAAVDGAQATYQGALASYRGGVRTAIKEVEQALVYLDSAAQRAASAQSAAKNYQDYFHSSERQWQAGMVSLLNLEEARRSALSSEVTWITLQRDRVQYWISLYRKLGGGWQADRPALSPTALSQAATAQ